MKYDPSKRAINHPYGEIVGEGEYAWESDWRNQCLEGKELSPQNQKSPVWMSLGGVGEGSKRPVVRFGASVNGPPKSIDSLKSIKWVKNKLLLVQMD
ncbi:hypothetical protein AVEN_177357-1 [Araneus ventricosus]|uniref:Uncharacterized protein n=1 Tax=Araneus ventricosus TaxID=182803 RepID=A0A4Y2QGK7_ARAVE|nr:hypothetical protein AVEN_98331-1 [Araneus ventricosus]GBN62169.1 hypothetical protein AVEN_257763-1 [Araneus ventricosus]GBN62187.1 hypothetical protein AVEN_39731-1 [Araneus ventricosus]GBN62263.1 hypothetical protein AVEN_177357-1 [Araneus ventricosus]